MTPALAGPRTVLRPVSDDDLPAIEAWWPEAAAAVRGLHDPEPTDFATSLSMLEKTGEVLVISEVNRTEPIGLLHYRLLAEEWVEFRFVAMAAGKRGWGHGSEAVFLIEESGVGSRFAAEVYHANGLGVYFWTRIGYRPTNIGEVPWRDSEPTDRIIMIRGDI